MKKLVVFIVSLMMISVLAFSQEEAKLTVKVSRDSILMGNYFEVKFKVENASVKNFEAPIFEGFTVVSGPNQSSSMMINNGAVTQSVTYSYYIKPQDIGYFFIEPAYVETDKGPLASIPVEVLVVANPDGIIQQPQQNSRNDFFNRDDFFSGENFFGGDDFFNDFFDKEKNPLLQDMEPSKPKKKKKKRKVYKL